MNALLSEYRIPLKHPCGIAFLCVSGSHMFGFDSPDSDYDLRGAHIARTRDILSMRRLGLVQETYSYAEPKGPGSEEMVTHEIAKFIELMAKNGGNLVEQILSPHVVYTSDTHQALRAIAPRVISKKHIRHYLGFADSQIVLMRRRPDKETKIFLYIFRVLMSGIVAARENVIESNLNNLCLYWEPSFAAPIHDVIAWKRSTQEENALYHQFSVTALWKIVDKLEDELKLELDRTALPDETSHDVVMELNDVLLHVRETAGR